MLFGNRKKTIDSKFLPYKNVQKNLQYSYQKNMHIDIQHVVQILCNEYNELNNIPTLKNQIQRYISTGNLSKQLAAFKYISELIPILSAIKQFNNHIFRASQAYGRIYMPLHCLKSKFRPCVRFGQSNEQIEQLFDIKCCFVQISAHLALNDAKTSEQKNEILLLLHNIKNDIYTDILKYSESSLSRQQIKKQILAWLFENRLQRIFNTNKIHNIISSYFRQKYPYFYKYVVFYNSVESKKLYKNNKRKKISQLSISCFKYESDLFFNYIFPQLHRLFPEIQFISLHDGIFIPKSKKQKFNLNLDNFKQVINKLVENYFI